MNKGQRDAQRRRAGRKAAQNPRVQQKFGTSGKLRELRDAIARSGK